MNQWVKVAVGLGSNLEDRRKNIETALAKLQEDLFEDPMQASPIYESEPWGLKEQPRFLNAVCIGLTEWKPPAILNYLKSLELELGRLSSVKNGPRLIDLDLLIYGDQEWQSDGLQVPHPGLPIRSFVLLPL